MLTIFKPGDILCFQKIDQLKLISGYPYNSDIYGRVLKNDIENHKIIFDVIVINGQVKVGLTEISLYSCLSFKLVDPELAESFNKHIRAYTKGQNKVFIDFVDLFNKADIDTKYKIMDYILTTEIKNELNESILL